MQRAVRISLAALMIGAIATVLSAWICVFVINPYDRPDSEGYVSRYDCSPFDDQATHRGWFTYFKPHVGLVEVGSSWLDVGVEDTLHGESGAQDPTEALPYWFDHHAPTTPSDPPGRHVRTATAYGWPMVALWSLDRADAVGNETPRLFPDRARDGITLWRIDRPWRPERTRSQRIVLPIRPIWTGFAICTLFYAIVAGLPLLACFSFVRRRCVRVIGGRRLKRGRCPKCRYDISGSDHANCPECGIVLS